MRKRYIHTKDMTTDKKKKLREELKEEYEYKLRQAEKSLPYLKENLKKKGYTLTDDFKVYKLVDGVAVWLSPIATLNVINGQPEITRQDKNRMIWTLRKEGKLRTPFFERSEVRAVIILCFIVVGFPVLAFFTFNMAKIASRFSKGEYANIDYFSNKERAIKNEEGFFQCHYACNELIPTNETEKEKEFRYKNKRAKLWNEFYAAEYSPLSLRKSNRIYLKLIRFSIKPHSIFSNICMIGLFIKGEIEYFFSWLFTVITTTDTCFSIDEKYDTCRIKDDVILALALPFIMGPFAAAFLYPVTIVIASFVIALILPVQLREDTCMTEDEIEFARGVLDILAAKSVLDSTGEINRRKNNSVKFHE